MRAIPVFVVLMFAFSAQSQSMIQSRFPMTDYNTGFAHRTALPDSPANRKWSFQKYVSLSAGYSFYRGGSASFVAAPVGLQLNRELNKNLYAFAGVSAAPVYLNFNSALAPAHFMKAAASAAFMENNTVGMYAKAELGLMYINDAKTFSISGSIGVERNRLPAFYSTGTTFRQNPVVLPNQ